MKTWEGNLLSFLTVCGVNFFPWTKEYSRESAACKAANFWGSFSLSS